MFFYALQTTLCLWPNISATPKSKRPVDGSAECLGGWPLYSDLSQAWCGQSGQIHFSLDRDFLSFRSCTFLLVSFCFLFFTLFSSLCAMHILPSSKALPRL